jgi:hypothetical protein
MTRQVHLDLQWSHLHIFVIGEVLFAQVQVMPLVRDPTVTQEQMGFLVLLTKNHSSISLPLKTSLMAKKLQTLGVWLFANSNPNDKQFFVTYFYHSHRRYNCHPEDICFDGNTLMVSCFSQPVSITTSCMCHILIVICLRFGKPADSHIIRVIFCTGHFSRLLVASLQFWLFTEKLLLEPSHIAV